jgi:hypothetical protein
VYSDAFHQHQPTDREKARVLLDPDQIDEYEQIVDAIYDRHTDAIARGFIIEGDPRQFTRYFRYYAGMTPAPERTCIIPGNRLIVSASGDLRLCFFHKSVGNIGYGEAEIRGLLTPERIRPLACGMNTKDSDICRNCSQFLDWHF